MWIFSNPLLRKRFRFKWGERDGRTVNRNAKIQYRSKMNSTRNDFKIWYVKSLSQSHFSLTSYDFLLSSRSFIFLRGEDISFLYRKNWKNKSKIWKLETEISNSNKSPIEQNGRFFDERYEKHPSCIYISTNKLFEDLLFKKKKNCNDKSTLSYFPSTQTVYYFYYFSFRAICAFLDQHLVPGINKNGATRIRSTKFIYRQRSDVHLWNATLSPFPETFTLSLHPFSSPFYRAR